MTYYAFRLAGLIAPHIPRRLGYWIMGLAAAVMYRMSAGNRLMIATNVRRVLGPQAGDDRIQSTTRTIFHNLLKNYFDLFWMPAQATDDVAKLVALHGMENADLALSHGKGAIVVAIHLGNQEIMTQLKVITQYNVTIVAEHVKPEKVFNYLVSLRQSDGLHIIPQDGALRELLRALKRNELIGLVFDRDVTDSGRVIDFFGAPAKLPDGYAILALRMGSPIIPVFCTRRPDGGYTISVEKPIHASGSANNDEDVLRVMYTVGAVIEQYVTRFIDQWVYFHYVWQQDKEGVSVG
jgi:lauroyl/myristoyl acyltransferase